MVKHLALSPIKDIPGTSHLVKLKEIVARGWGVLLAQVDSFAFPEDFLRLKIHAGD